MHHGVPDDGRGGGIELARDEHRNLLVEESTHLAQVEAQSLERLSGARVLLVELLAKIGSAEELGGARKVVSTSLDLHRDDGNVVFEGGIDFSNHEGAEEGFFRLKEEDGLRLDEMVREQLVQIVQVVRVEEDLMRFEIEFIADDAMEQDGSVASTCDAR